MLKNILNSFAKNIKKQKFLELGVSINEYNDYTHSRIDYMGDLTETSFLNRRIKRINSYSYLHTIEGLFLEGLYKFKASKNNPYIIDCGANMGLSLIYFKRLYPNAKIVAFEPDKKLYDACKFNIKQFELEDIELINAGVWKFDGTLCFQPDNSLGGMIVDNDAENVDEVAVVSLNKFLKTYVDFLKIDVEGAELEVLNSCKQGLRNVENIFVEYHSKIKEPQQLDKLLTILSDAGFRYYIKPAWDYLEQPFLNKETIENTIFDLQLNIFAFRR